MRLITATASGKAEAIGARAVLARSMVDCAAGVVLIAAPLCQSSRCEPGTARAPVMMHPSQAENVAEAGTNNQPVSLESKVNGVETRPSFRWIHI